MYRPPLYRVVDASFFVPFIRANPFGLLVSPDGESPIAATHVPFVWQSGPTPYGQLVGHLARANPQARSLGGSRVLVVFQGPHAYISPAWYGAAEAVPTWDYQAVHATGTATLMEGAELTQVLRDAIRFFDPDLPLADQLQQPFYQDYQKAVVGFRVDVEQIQGQSKLSQNRTPAERLGVMAGLRVRGGVFDGMMADLIGATLPPETKN